MVFLLAVASCDGCQDGCLHPAQGIVAQPRGHAHGIAGIDAQNPVRLVPAIRRSEEAVVAAVRFQVFHPFADGFIRQGGCPQAQAGLRTFQIGVHIAEGHFPLTAGIRGRNDGVAAAEHLFHDLQLQDRLDVRNPSVFRADMLYRQLEVRRDEGKVLAAQLSDSVILGHGQRKHVTECPGDEISVSFQVSVSCSGGTYHSSYYFSYVGFVCQYGNHDLLSFIAVHTAFTVWTAG